VNNDRWLDKWLPLLQQKSTNESLLELGCGDGRDTSELLSAGCKVIATDISSSNLAACAQSASHANLVQMDNGKLFPFADRSVSVIIASLSLHYFTWEVTMQIASELKRCVLPGGLLLARFNSTEDYNYGASSPLEIEPNLRQVGTRTKRFFDESSVRLFIQGWDIQFLEENVIYRYEKPKAVWEVMAFHN